MAGGDIERLFADSPFVERLCVIDAQHLNRLELVAAAAAAAANLKYLKLSCLPQTLIN